MVAIENFQPPTGADDVGNQYSVPDWTSWQAAAALDSYSQTTTAGSTEATGTRNLATDGTSRFDSQSDRTSDFLDFDDAFSNTSEADSFGDGLSFGDDLEFGGTKELDASDDTDNRSGTEDTNETAARDRDDDQGKADALVSRAMAIANATAAAISAGDPLSAPDLNVALAQLQDAISQAERDGLSGAVDALASARSLITNDRVARESAGTRLASSNPIGLAASSAYGLSNYPLPNLLIA